MADNLQEHRLTLVEGEVREIRSELKNHTKDHKRVDDGMKDHGERIVKVEAIVPLMVEATKENTSAINTLTESFNDVAIQLAVNNQNTQSNTDFRNRFTWKEILALCIGLGTVIGMAKGLGV